METRQFKEKKFWDWFASKYDLFIKKTQNKTYQSILANIDLSLKSNFKVLDIGTGTGIIPFSIYSKVSSIIATDISVGMIRVAKDKQIELNIENIDFQVQDSYFINFPDKSFDLVIASNLLHLLYDPEKVLKEVKRVMKDNGLFIAPTFCVGENIKSKVISNFVGFLSGFKVVNQWNLDDFKSTLTNNGFFIEKEEWIEGRIPLAYIVMKTEFSNY